jgi:Rrf2 family protein
MFSQTCKYALHFLFFTAQKQQPSAYVPLKLIADELGAPLHFTAKVLQELARRNFITSAKGPNGGFRLNSTQLKTPLLEVVKAFDGDKVYTSCCIGSEMCNENNPCAIHNDCKAIRSRIYTMLFTTYVEAGAMSQL